MLFKDMTNDLSFLIGGGGLLLSAVAIIVSIISLARSSKSMKMQDRVNELDEKIKQYELEKIEREKLDPVVACVEARAIKNAKSDYGLKIWNSGKATAYDVTVQISEGTNLTIHDSKLPFEELEPGKNFELILFTDLQSSHKFKVTTQWKDADGNMFEKSQWTTL